MITDPVVIVAGASQSGTTSLYELFSQTQGISASNIKELDFWHRPDITNMSLIDIEAEYLDQFPNSSNNTIRFEASPAYLRHGIAVVGMIKQCLSNVKIIIILRNPHDRLYAVYRKMKVEDIFVHNIELDDFLQIAKTGLWKGKATSESIEIQARADVGNYLNYLRPYLDNFSPQQLAIINFHQLIKNPTPILKKLELFVGLPVGTFTSSGLPWTNKNDAVNSFWVHYFAKSLYMHLEPVFRRHLWLKNAMRNAYLIFNSRKRTKSHKRPFDTSTFPYQSNLDEIIEAIRPYVL